MCNAREHILLRVGAEQHSTGSQLGNALASLPAPCLHHKEESRAVHCDYFQ